MRKRIRNGSGTDGVKMRNGTDRVSLLLFSKPIRRLEPIERPAEEARIGLKCGTERMGLKCGTELIWG